MYAYTLFCISDHDYRHEILAFPEMAKYLLPPSFEVEPDIYEAGDFILFAWHSKSDPHDVRRKINPGLLVHPTKGAFFCSGYTAEGLIDCPNRDRDFGGQADKEGVFNLIQPSTAGVRLVDSLGGVSSCAWISKDGRVAQCWSTQPPAVPTFFSKNREGFCVVSNRPRLSYCASILSTCYTVSDDYLAKYISSGFAFDSVTPYPATVAVPPNKSIRLSGALCETLPYPIEPPPATPQVMPLEEKAANLAQKLRDACWPARAVGRSRLFLSGGKDSRALSCALSGENEIFAFTIGSISSGEGFTASEVATRLGCAFETRTQAVISDALKAAANSNRSTDGLGINFAHQFNFRHDLDFLEGLPSFHGHGHLLRGGFARTMAGDTSKLTVGLYNAFLSPFAADAAHSIVIPHIDNWLSYRKEHFRDGRDVLFYSNMDFRLGLFTAPASLDLTSRTFMVYPLLDERVARYASSLSVFDRVSERVVFGAMQMLAKDVTELPLFGEIWRFDRSPDKRDFVDSDHNFQEGFHLRQPREATKLSELNVHKTAFTYDADKGHIPPTGKQAASFVLDSTRRNQIEDLVHPYVFDELVSLASSGRNTSEHAKRDANTRFNLNSFINRVFIASTLYDLRW